MKRFFKVVVGPFLNLPIPVWKYVNAKLLLHLYSCLIPYLLAMYLHMLSKSCLMACFFSAFVGNSLPNNTACNPPFRS